VSFRTIIRGENFRQKNFRKALISSSLIVLIFVTPILMVPAIPIRSAGAQPSSNGEEQPSAAMNVSKPVTPKVLEANLSSLPSEAPWRPGEPVVEAPGQEFEDEESEGGNDQPPPTISRSNETNGNQTLTNPNTLNLNLSRLAPEAPLRPGEMIQEAPGQQFEGGNQPPPQNSTDMLNQTGATNQTGTSSSSSSDPISAPLANFDGIPATGFVPPDTVGDVGPNHYVQAVNVQFAIYDKAGTLLVGPSNINSLWVAANTNDACQFNNHGDPIVQYDHLANRWLISQFAIPGPDFHECIAISRTSDPVTGGWFLYDFTMSAFPDYPKIAVWPDAYYMGTNAGYPTGHAWAFDRANMLNGNPATVVGFSASGAFMIPSDLEGPPPPAGTPHIFLRFVDGAEFGGVDRLEMRQFHVDFANPALSTFTALPDLPTAAFDSNLCGFGFRPNCIPQPGTSQLLDTLRGEPMYRLQYRNFGTHESLVVNQVVDVNGADLAGIRWYELRNVGGGPWSIFQQGDYSPDGTHRWMGSIAMDKNGNMALGYSVSSTTVFPGISYTGRVSSDPLGTMTQGESTIVNGGGSQSFPGNPSASRRWGDYSSLNVDPTDDCTFWYTTEYFPTSANWQTRIASFKFSECNDPPVANDQSVTTNQNTPRAITLSATDPDGDPITYSIVTNPDPSRGSLNTFNPSTGTLIYAPIPSYFGPDSFTFKATDSEGADSNTATVSIEVKGPPDCNNPTIIGNDNGNDVIQGTSGNDVIVGLGGNDVINGNGGDDEICGGNGNDVINSGAGNDRINSGAGNDVINSGAGIDQLYGIEGIDIIDSGAGNDLIDGGPNNDIGSGGTGQDTCFNLEFASSCET
jgi:Ca2+-binding RTX toxin-like protein